jgi:hypothetical protein
MPLCILCPRKVKEKKMINEKELTLAEKEKKMEKKR